MGILIVFKIFLDIFIGLKMPEDILIGLWLVLIHLHMFGVSQQLGFAGTAQQRVRAAWDTR